LRRVTFDVKAQELKALTRVERSGQEVWIHDRFKRLALQLCRERAQQWSQ
jgi:hypothetical protein